MTTDCVNSIGPHDISQNRSSLHCSGPPHRSSQQFDLRPRSNLIPMRCQKDGTNRVNFAARTSRGLCDGSTERMGVNLLRSVSPTRVRALHLGHWSVGSERPDNALSPTWSRPWDGWNTNLNSKSRSVTRMLMLFGIALLPDALAELLDKKPMESDRRDQVTEKAACRQSCKRLSTCEECSKSL